MAQRPHPPVPTASSAPPSLEVGLPCPEGFNFMRGSRGQGARPFLGTELRTGAKVIMARLGAHRAGIRGGGARVGGESEARAQPWNWGQIPLYLYKSLPFSSPHS